uniref:Uncharacterized protein n=1 Tax=Rhizophora mucronata TaxID=61149 RepID=A0A2P2PXJ0_RHIMU
MYDINLSRQITIIFNQHKPSRSSTR